MNKTLQPLLQPYIPIVCFLSQALGENCEVSLHAFEDNMSHIIALKNSQNSNSKLGDDSTSWFTCISNYTRDKDYEFLCNFKIRNHSDDTIRASYYFIRNEQFDLVGILCIHSDISYLEKAKELLHKLTSCSDSDYEKNRSSSKNTNTCCCNDTLEETVKKLLNEKAVPFDRMLPDEKFEFVTSLYNHGVFTIKNSVPRVSSLLQTSEPTIYRYLQKIKCISNNK